MFSTRGIRSLVLLCCICLTGTSVTAAEMKIFDGSSRVILYQTSATLAKTATRTSTHSPWRKIFRSIKNAVQLEKESRKNTRVSNHH